jgi:hypothetical protein
MTKNIVIGVLAVLTLLFGFLYVTQQSVPFGAVPTGTVHYQGETFQGGLQIGQRGTFVTNMLKGTCSLIAPSFSVVASTSVAMDCAVTGVQAGDTVFAMLASSTATAIGPGWEITGVSASTTSGFITIALTNGTGGTAVIPASLASTTRYLILR